MCKPRIVNNVSSDVSIVSNTSVVDYISIVRSVSTVSKVSIVCRRKKKECEHNKKEIKKVWREEARERLWANFTKGRSAHL